MRLRSIHNAHGTRLTAGSLAVFLAVSSGCGDDNLVEGDGGIDVNADGGRDSGGPADGGDLGGPADGGTDASVVDGGFDAGSLPGSREPADSTVQRFEQPKGDAMRGREVFRRETFGNEGFWTRVARLPQGLKTVTPIRLLQLGLNLDSEMLPTNLKGAITSELRTDLSIGNAPTLNSVATTEALLEAGAVVGLPAINVVAANGTIDIDDTDIYAGESVGMSCALCHSVTDGSLYKPAAGMRGGAVGKRMDGSGNHDLEFGKMVALAEGSRAYYPTLALQLAGNGGKSVSRRGPGMNLISAAGGRGRCLLERRRPVPDRDVRRCYRR